MDVIFVVVVVEILSTFLCYFFIVILSICWMCFSVFVVGKSIRKLLCILRTSGQRVQPEPEARLGRSVRKSTKDWRGRSRCCWSSDILRRHFGGWTFRSKKLDRPNGQMMTIRDWTLSSQPWKADSIKCFTIWKILIYMVL